MPRLVEPKCLDIQKLWEEFVDAKRFLKNVTEKTQKFYGSTWICFRPWLSKVVIDIDARDQQRHEQEKQLVRAVRTCMTERQKSGEVSARSFNSYLTTVNAFTKWAWTEGHFVKQHKFEKLLVENKHPDAFGTRDIEAFIKYRPKSPSQCRAHTIGILILDTGMRIDEALSLTKDNLNLRDAIVDVQKGKGRKQRIVPLSTMGVQKLFRYLKDHPVPTSRFLFSTSNGRKMLQRNALRDLAVVQRNAGIPESGWHKFRHTFGSSYIRNGGNVVVLQKIMGHAHVDTTMLYVHMQTDDLKRDHTLFSALQDGSGR